MMMHTMTNWHTETLKIIVQKLGKLIEVGLTQGIPTRPPESERLIRLKGESGIELLDDLLIIVTLNIYKLEQTKPLHDSQSITKIFRLLPEMGAIQHMHVTHPLGHRAIDVFINAFLSNTPETSISKIFSSLRIPVRLPQSNIVH
jgi:hypothetical protein